MFYFIANNLSLDFANTLAAENGVEKELIPEYKDLVDWAAEVKIIDAAQAKRLMRDWNGLPEAEKAIGDAHAFRARLREMSQDLADGRAVSRAVVEAINALLRDKTGFSEVRAAEDGYEKTFVAEFSEPSQLLAPIAESAADLLCYGNLENVRKCENAQCVLHFYDVSKNHRRRWCSMAACGNRAKASAFYRRKSQRSA